MDRISGSRRNREFFPGSCVKRPGLDFAKTSRPENMTECRKHYRSSDSHFLGIFTVQCCCNFPKVLGISVFPEFEGVSIALSVLSSRIKFLCPECYLYKACNMLGQSQLEFHGLKINVSLSTSDSVVRFKHVTML